jgi:TonB family protein
MSDLWKQCEGQLVENQFPLLQFLGNTNHSAVFLTKLDHPEPLKAAIKFISADIPAPDEQLAILRRAAQLDHPQLLRVFHHGRCRIAGMNLLYVVMESADENLSQFLPLRPLNAEETRDVLNPLVDALVYLHAQGFAHSHVKPSNLLAIADQLKLSSDTILPIGDSREAYRDRDIYDAPESITSSTFTASTADDVWSLGVTLVETLTQHPPPLPFDDSLDPVVPESLPQPFLEIARNTLLRDPLRRWSISQISAHLNPAPVAVAASASASVAASAAAQIAPAVSATPPVSAPVPSPLAAAVHPSPLSIPLSQEPAVPLAKLPMPKTSSPRVKNERVKDETYPESSAGLPSYVIPVALGVLVLIGAYFMVPKFFHRAEDSSVSSASSPLASSDAASSRVPSKPASSRPAASSAPVPSSTNSNPVAPPKSPAATAPTKLPAENPAKSSPAREPAPESARPAESTPAPPVSTTPAKSSTSSPDDGEVLDQVLPKASASALATIQGAVRVVVRVQVDPAGNVTSSNLDSPGPSKYFADQAQRAAQKWKFASPASEGHSQPSQWQIRFEFTHSGVNAVPTQIPR